ncbi:hypothetical protein C0Q70_07226 [Pomacea canaliculata]|uniref:Claudin n=1 Tax=Pomacea canaliculata TaxID=400727 RepID=A0A2T7PEG3_POMCA|nr:hypothetical protein C0Q70_07226 [Pomacea canaliculata]
MASIATPLIVAFVLLGIGLLLHIIGFAVPQWHDQEWMTSERYLVRVTYGLWRYCYNSWHRRSMDPEVCTSIVDSQYDRDGEAQTVSTVAVTFSGASKA